MEKKNNRKGFTLAELLIVVAIIAVLVAIAIPVFTSQLEKSRESTDLANVRTAYADAVVQVLNGSSTDISVNVPVQQKVDGWQNGTSGKLTGYSDGGAYSITVPAKKTGDWTVKVNSQTGAVTIE